MICFGTTPALVWMHSMTRIFSALTFLILSWTTPLLAEVVIGYANISARVSRLWIAQDKGFFAKYGVAVQPVYMPGSPVMIASLSTGQIQLANSGGTAALGAAAGGLDLKVIGTFTSRIPFDLVVKPTIKSAQDLRGKRLGVQVIGRNDLDGRDARARTLGARSPSRRCTDSRGRRPDDADSSTREGDRRCYGGG